MKLTYRPTFSNIFNAVVYGFWGTPQRAMKTVLACLFIGGLTGVFIFVGYHVPLAFGLAVGVVGTIVWAALFTFAFGAWAAHSATKRQLKLAPTQAITISDEGVERAVGPSVRKVEWAGITSVEESRLGFMLYSGKSPIMFIEKSATSSESELRELRDFLRGKKPGNYANS